MVSGNRDDKLSLSRQVTVARKAIKLNQDHLRQFKGSIDNIHQDDGTIVKPILICDTKDNHFESDVIQINKNLYQETFYKAGSNPDKCSQCINVDNAQTGTGKTERMVQEIRRTIEDDVNTKLLVFSNTHNLLTDIKKRIGRKYKVVILEGFKRLCKHLDDKTVQMLIDKNIPKYMICTYMSKGKCKGKRCKYKEQFSNAEKANVVLAPNEFVYIKDFNDYDKIYFDESIKDAYLTKTFNYGDFKRALDKIDESKFTEEGLLKNAIHLAVFTKDIEFLKDNLQAIKNIIFTHNKHVSYYRTRSLLKNYCDIKIDDVIMLLDFTRNDEEVVEITKNLSLNDIIFYKHYLTNANIEFIAASFPRTFLTILHNFQTIFHDYDVKVDVKFTKFYNLQCNTFLCCGKGFYKSHFTEYMETDGKDIKNLIERLLYKEHKKVCVLTFQDAIKKNKFYGADAFHFWSLEGVNKFERYDAIVVIGTPLYPESVLVDKFQHLYPGIETPAIEFIDTEHYRKYTDLHYQQFQEELQDQVYNWISRVRPLKIHQSNKVCEIFILGKNPPRQLFSETVVKCLYAS